MLIRLISVIALIQFMLLLISGANVNIALYRSLLVFMVLFAAIYLTIFFLNIIQKSPETENATVADGGSSTKQAEQ